MSEAETTYYRYMSRAEADAVEATGLLRGGRRGRTYWTDVRYGSAREAQRLLALDSLPEVRVAFTIRGAPEISLDGTMVRPKSGMPGGGAEWMSHEKVEVEVIAVDNLE